MATPSASPAPRCEPGSSFCVYLSTAMLCVLRMHLIRFFYCETAFV